MPSRKQKNKQKNKQQAPRFLPSVAEAAAKHLGVVIVTIAVGAAALVYSGLKRYLPFGSDAALRDFTGSWQVTIGGNQTGRMAITQTPSRELRGTFVLDNYGKGVLRGTHDGYSFYSLALDGGDKAYVFVETADVRAVEGCLQADAQKATFRMNRDEREVTFSARRCSM